MRFQLDILPLDLLEEYKAAFDRTLYRTFDQLKDSELSTSDFSFYVSVSAVYSSKIEGEAIELDSYIKHKRFGTKYQPDYTKKIDDLYDAYRSVYKTIPYKATISQAHAMLTRHILDASQQGKLRTTNMYVVTPDGKIEYVAASPAKAQKEMEKFYFDLARLMNNELSFEEVFYFASMLHLVFIKIHPFHDGNGRMARLLEKWFLSVKINEKAWFIPSERYYYDHHQTYYDNIRKLGLEYDTLNYKEAMPFLQMLPDSLRNTK